MMLENIQNRDLNSFGVVERNFNEVCGDSETKQNYQCAVMDRAIPQFSHRAFATMLKLE